jgi:hypothetical protein
LDSKSWKNEKGDEDPKEKRQGSGYARDKTREQVGTQ